MLVVFDPNVIVSALITPAGIARRVLQAGIEGRFVYVLCPMLQAELDDVCRRPKITALVPPGAVERFLADVRGGAHPVADPTTVAPITRDPGDDYLVALAATLAADHLVTGDADLLDLDDAPVRITSLRAFADLLATL